jgi:hypothetical protein
MVNEQVGAGKWEDGVKNHATVEALPYLEVYEYGWIHPIS